MGREWSGYLLLLPLGSVVIFWENLPQGSRGTTVSPWLLAAALRVITHAKGWEWPGSGGSTTLTAWLADPLDGSSIKDSSSGPCREKSLSWSMQL